VTRGLQRTALTPVEGFSGSAIGKSSCDVCRHLQLGIIVRVSRGVWGLQEWYPNQRFARRGAEG
jgi:hypothetical protein